LAWTGHNLREPARLGEPLGQDGGLGSLEADLLFTQCLE
jgi:hypothetical protein